MFLSRSNGQKDELKIDEYLFHAVLKRGRIVSKPTELYAEAIDFSNKNYIFRMTLLESSIVSENWPNFDTVGLVGEWKLMTNGLVKLVKCYESNDPKLIMDFLKSSKSNLKLDYV